MKYFKNSIINIGIFITLIISMMSCGADDEMSVMSEDYLPLDIGNSWVFINPEDPDTQVTVSITGVTALSDGRKATVVTAAEDDAEGDKGYVSKTADDLLLAHSAIDDLQGELFYTPAIKVGSRWEGDRGREAQVVAREDVSTPAGVFKNCFRIDLLRYGYRYATVWLANNVGPVKLQEIENVDAGIVLDMWFSPDGQTLTSAASSNSGETYNGSIIRWDVNTGERLSHLNLKNMGAVATASFSMDGTALAIGGGADTFALSSLDDGSVRLWDVETGELRYTPTAYIGYVNSVSFSADGRTLATGYASNTVRLWDVETGELRYTHTARMKIVRSVSLSSDGRTLAIGGADWVISVPIDRGRVHLWDVETGKRRHTLIGHKDYVNIVSFSPDDTTLATGGDDGVHLWDVETGERRHTLIGHTRYVNIVSFSADGRTLASAATGYGDDGVRLWDVETGERRHTLLIGHEDSVRSVSFSADGRTLASGNYDGTVHLWNVRTGELLRTLEEPIWAAGETIVLEKFNVR